MLKGQSNQCNGVRIHSADSISSIHSMQTNPDICTTGAGRSLPSPLSDVQLLQRIKSQKGYPPKHFVGLAKKVYLLQVRYNTISHRSSECSIFATKSYFCYGYEYKNVYVKGRIDLSDVKQLTNVVI